MNDRRIVLECKGLSRSFGSGKLKINVLNELNLAIYHGERVAIVGSSGSGKTTLLHLLGGLDKPNTGQVLLMGDDLAKVREKQRCRIRNTKLGFVYQFHHLLPEFTALENVCMPLLIGRMPAKVAKVKAASILDKVGLAQRHQHRIGELSGGERQRVAIARALVTDPLCVLADEPTGNLDKHTAESVYETMLQLNEELQTAFIVVTHDHELAAKMQRVFTIEDGHLAHVERQDI